MPCLNKLLNKPTQRSNSPTSSLKTQFTFFYGINNFGRFDKILIAENMETFTSKKVTLNYKQINNAPPEKVFPLLCPVREKDWLDGWNYKMVYSKSGVAEDGCVFTTPHHSKNETVWIVTKYDPANFEIAFVRVTSDDSVVSISINLQAIEPHSTYAFIEYEYTSLSAEQTKYLENELEKAFQSSMRWWEKAINYYLENGKMLSKENAE
jgi:hypothetical protein